MNYQIDLKNSPTLLLSKDKEFLKQTLSTNSIGYFEYPPEQRVNGLDVIEVGDTLFWFDCEGVIYSISTGYKINKPRFPFRFDGKYIVNDINYEKILSFLDKIGEKFSERETEEYRFVVYEAFDHVFYIFNLENDKISGFLINYDGYSRYQYKKGISLSDFLKDKSRD